MSKCFFKSFVYVMEFSPDDGRYYYIVGISNNPERLRKKLKRKYNVDHAKIIWQSPNLTESTAHRIENELLNRISETHEMVRKGCFYAQEPLKMVVKIRREYSAKENLETVEIDILKTVGE